MNEDVKLNNNTMKEQSTLRAMINEIVTREEFTGAFTDVLKIVKEVKDTSSVEWQNLRDAVTKLNDELNASTNQSLSDVRSKIEVALQSQIGALNAKLEQVDKKVASLKDGKDGLPGTPADEVKIVDKVLSQLPPPPLLEPKVIRDRLETLRDEDRLDASAIKNLPKMVKNIATGHGGIHEVRAGSGVTVDNTVLGFPIVSASGSASPLTTKGDLYTYSTVDARLPAGNNGQVLSADSTATTGLKWVAATTGTGDVVGPASATDGGVALFDTTTGKLLKNSNLTLSASTLEFDNTSARIFDIAPTANTVVGRALTISAGSTVTAGTADMAGGNLTLNSGLGKGTGASSILFQTGRTLTTGSTLQTLTTAMTILGSGNVGIGTTSPGAKLEVYTGTSNGLGEGIRINRPASTNYSGLEYATAGVLDWGQGVNSAGFGIYENGMAATTRFLIQDGGNVGIGTTSPTAYLHLKAGTATASTAPLKLTSGIVNTIPEAGAIEFDGTDLFITI